jgi:hypothetical protein
MFSIGTCGIWFERVLLPDWFESMKLQSKKMINVFSRCIFNFELHLSYLSDERETDEELEWVNGEDNKKEQY